MRRTTCDAVLALAAVVVFCPASAAAQQQPSAGDLTARLEEVGRRLKNLTGHVEQMRSAVREDPSLAGRMGSLPELEAVLSTGRLLGSVAMQLETTSRQIDETLRTSGDSLDASVRREYRKLQASLAPVLEALAGTATRYDSLRKSLHDQDGG